jgi:hypothetical protein
VTGLHVETPAWQDTLVLDRGSDPKSKVLAGRTSLAQVILIRRHMPAGDISLWVEHPAADSRPAGAM